MNRVTISALPALLAAASISAPALPAALSLAVFFFFSPVCHQDPARSFWLVGAPIAVCARCIGLYLGAAAGAWLRAPQRVLLPVFILALAVNLLDVATELVGLHGNWLATRFVLGILLGGSAGALVGNWAARQQQYQLATK